MQLNEKAFCMEFLRFGNYLRALAFCQVVRRDWNHHRAQITAVAKGDLGESNLAVLSGYVLSSRGGRQLTHIVYSISLFSLSIHTARMANLLRGHNAPGDYFRFHGRQRNRTPP